MPLKRTPEKQNPITKSTNNDNPKQHSNSTPNLSDISNIMQRPIKRKQGDDFELFAEKMETLFKTWQTHQEKQLNTLISKIDEQQAKITSSVQFISEQYDSMKSIIDQLLQEKKDSQLYIQSLENKVEVLERNARISSVEIRNVPFKNGETTSDLLNIVHSFGKSLQIPVQQSDIKDIFRVKKNNNNKFIIVDFCSVITKNRIVSAVKQLNKESNGSRPNTEDLGIVGPNNKIFLSDSLTSKAKRLLFLAKDFSKTHGYDFAWQSHGNIYIRKKPGDPALRVNCEQDLRKLQKN